MAITLSIPTPARPDEVHETVGALRAWQRDGLGVPLHPGDIGWHRRLGGEANAAALRLWRRDGRPVAVALLDGPTVARIAVDPAVGSDEGLAARMADDLAGPAVLPASGGAVEARTAAALTARLTEAGWARDEPWAPLVRDLGDPVGPPDGPVRLRVEVVDASDAAAIADRVAVQVASFEGSRFSVEQWHAMASGPVYRAGGRCLVGYDDGGTAAAAITVWSAGPGRPGLIEPLGVDPAHRGRGHGRAITLAAATELRAMGASSVGVATEATRAPAIATYVSAGSTPLPVVHDLRR